MLRLKIFFLIFFTALSIPMGYFVWHSCRSMAQEEKSELRYFGNTLFEKMEEELAILVQNEEARAIDDYTFRSQLSGKGITPPIGKEIEKPHVLGYLQNNPDGSFQTPLSGDYEKKSVEDSKQLNQLDEINKIFNEKRSAVTTGELFRPAEIFVAKVKEDVKKSVDVVDISGKYFDSSRSQKKKSYLGRKVKRVEQIPARQALNVAPQAQQEMMVTLARKSRATDKPDEPLRGATFPADSYLSEDKEVLKEVEESEENIPEPAIMLETEIFQVEVDPMQSVFIDDDRIFIFRRIVIKNQIYRQGVVIAIKPFLRHLAESHFVGQPMAQFTNLQFKIIENGKETEIFRTGAITKNPVFNLYQTFPRPFSFIRASLTCDDIPKSTGRRTLKIMMGFAILVILMGSFAIYHSARKQVDLSERRSSFVSSVTHELKTPLTNIRMYIEMLDQGIAITPEREQDYFRILGSESARLSSLINNVLEFSRLEKKKRYADLREGTLEDVLHEVAEVMQQKLKQEGFTLAIEQESGNVFSYDREMMIQIILNLIENSMKFGKNASQKEITVRVMHSDGQMKISVSDTGPGISKHALKKVFDDFFRVDSEFVRNTRGTGIGLALVRRFVSVMGGSVRASNNVGAGCTITISIPA